VGAIAEVLSAVQPAFRAKNRRRAQELAQAVLPASMVVWRAPTDHRQAERKRKAGRVALTFDDGPTPLTREYLTVLERLGARATFFVVGELCARHPDIVAEIAARGHELCGHGYTHRRFTELSPAELTDELERTQALLPPSTRSRPFVRPPHGAMSLRSMITCSRRGFTTVLWSFNSDDWCNKETSQVEGTFSERTPEAGEIVLLHDGQSWTVNALPTIVGALERAGHELVTVGELLG
jgi:peptidoglycan-N-acetylglucosamine deacetylase